MPFKFRRGTEDVEVTAKDIIGLTEEEVKEKFGKIDSVVAAQEENKTTLKAIQDTLKALEGKVATPVVKPNNSSETEDERTPEQKMLDATLQISLDTKATVIQGQVASRQENVYWNELEKEIMELTKNDRLQDKCNPAYWQNAYEIVVGRHVKDISEGKLKARRLHFVESASNSAGGGNNNTNTDDGKTPTELDKKQAEKFHIPIEKYMETKAKLKVV